MDIISNYMNQIMLYLLITVGIMLLFVGIASLRNPLIAKLGLRNIPRRPAQSILIVVGLTLSTIIIVSSLSMGDTLNNSLRSQAVSAYGQIDEVLSPPLLATLTQFGLNPTENNSRREIGDEAADQVDNQPDLLAGGLSSFLALLQDGLPGISEERYAELRDKVQEEPLIDGVASSIIFPTIIRDVSSGQGEPFGFIFGVDSEYQEQFGLRSVDGRPIDMDSLRPGVGNVFEGTAGLFTALVDTSTEVASQLGVGEASELNTAQIVLGAVALGAVLTQIDVEDIQNLNFEDLNLDALDPNNIDPENFDLATFIQSLELENLNLEGLGLDAITPDSVDLNQLNTDFLTTLNLNTLGSDIDDVLGQAGLELRHGEVYLSRIGAERLNAQTGDVLEIHIGPIPVPYRVKGIVEEAGPMAALSPVAVMQLSEVQRLLFMEGQVNSVLISNQGDAVEGMQYTDEVNERLRVLSLNEEGVENMVALLNRSDVRPRLDWAIEQEAESGLFGDDPGDRPPAVVEDIIADIFNLEGFSEDLQELAIELDKAEVSDTLRQHLANRNIQIWLLAELPNSLEGELFTAIGGLTELDLVEPLSKQTIVTAASAGGLAFTSVFSLFGIFSILAGILLIFMIFVMLAAERRSELGMSRAIGMQRRQLVQMFVTEGVVYDLVAAALGVLLGLGITYAMIGFVSNVFNEITGSLSDQGGFFTFQFDIVPSSVIISYCLGVLFTFIVVTYSSFRVSRLNIVAAIRNLPEDAFTKRIPIWRQISGLIFSLALLAGGYYIIFMIDETLEITRTQIGGTLALVGLAFVLGWIFERTSMRAVTRERFVYSLIGIGLLVVWVVPWSSWLEGQGAVFEQNPATVLLSFILTGPLFILGAILTVMYNADILVWIVNRLLGGIGPLTPVLKTAIAYPLSNRFRTGMAMLLFAMIIATVTIMSVVIQVTQTIVTQNDEDTAGFEIQVDYSLLSFFNQINDLSGEIERNPDFPQEDVAAVARVSTQGVIAEQSGGERSTTRIHGINPGYIKQAQSIYSFQARAPGYESDEAIWQALNERDDVAIVKEWMVEQNNTSNEGDGPRGDRVRHFFRLSNITLPDSLNTVTEFPEIWIDLEPTTNNEFGPLNNALLATGQSTRVQIIGVLRQETTLAEGGFQVNDRVIETLTGLPVVPDRFYVKAAEGADPRVVAQEVERAFISGGLNATLMAESFAAGQSITRGVLQLFQGFMALGLLVGIAALGVISSRTVVERRQQIGMLRAIGYQPRMVALSFILEASFIALVGIGIGTATGVLLGQNIISEFYSVVTDGESFATPWGQIGMILLGAYLFSLLTTILPAYQASRIYPAEALRYS